MSLVNKSGPSAPPTQPSPPLLRHKGVSKDEFADFYATHKDACLRATMASGMSRDAAEDAVAEAFARAWVRWRRVRESRSPAAWVVRTAVNADISAWRRRRREQSYAEVPAAGVAPGFDAGVAFGDAPGHAATDLLAAIRRLPPRQRAVVVHRYLLDLDTETTAAELGITTGTVKAHLHHALAALRVHLATPEGTH